MIEPTTNAITWPPELPLVAILRGLQSERADDIARVLFDAGFRALEVPLNRPGAISAIATIVPLAPADAWIGAGTVLDTAQVDAVGDTGASLIVSPHFDAKVVRRASERGMRTVPGVFTASEAFAAWHAGADALKIFPAEAMTHAGLTGLATVLPPALPIWPVGGIVPDNMAAWLRAGATGFGLGGGLFKPELSVAEIAKRARAYVDAWNACAPALSK
jgi:2-dehydro-3-deoxyphosphogalactonate aldolase